MASTRIIVTQYGLCIQFQTLEAKNVFLSDMKKNGINMFTHEVGTHCYVQKFTDKDPCGQFISQENRVAMVFLSEKAKFIFKERLNLASDSFMDLGPGYDAQMHFNPKILPFVEGASIVTHIDIDTAESELSTSKYR